MSTAPPPRSAADHGRLPHQFRLMGQRRYAPFFWMLFLGAFNDNLLKFVVVLVLTYQVQVSWLPPEQVGPVLGGIFILPSVLWSVLAGQVVDRFDQHQLMRWGKLAELAMMLLAGWSLVQQSVTGLLLSVLLSGVHVTLFSTLKYAYPARHLAPHELVGGNGLLETGTFTAILLGTVAGGLSMGQVAAHPESTAGLGWTVAGLIGVALAGWWCARQVPVTSAAAPQVQLDALLWRSAVAIVREVRPQPALWWSLMGVSWMWAFGSVMFSLFPAIAKDVLHAAPEVAAVLLVVSTVGVAAGALSCERLSRTDAGHHPDLGLVLPGGVLMAVCGADMARVVGAIAADPTMATVQAYGLDTFVAHPLHAWGLMDLGLMSVGMAWFSVPWYARMQAQASDASRARVVGANNLLNALFILVVSVAVSVMLASGLTLGGVMMTAAVAQVLWLLWAGWRHPACVQDALSLWRRWRGRAT